MKSPLRHAETLEKLKPQDADTDHFIKCIDELFRMGTRQYKFTGGDPFLHKDFLKLASRAKSSGASCFANTSGTLLNPDLADELIMMGFDDIRITTMAGTPDVYAATHPGTKKKIFQTLQKNLEYIKKKKAALKIKKPKITLAFVIVRQNCQDIMSFAEFAVKMGVEAAQYRALAYNLNNRFSSIEPTADQISSIKKRLEEAGRFLNSNGIQHDISDFFKIFSGKRDTSSLYRHIPCYAGWTWIYIEPDGNIHPCCASALSLGNASKRTLKEIWNGSAYQAFRKKAISINKKKRTVQGCACDDCGNFISNIKIYRKIHPLKAGKYEFRQLRPQKY